MKYTVVSLFVFGRAFTELLREKEGTLIYVGAPKVQKEQGQNFASSKAVNQLRITLSVSHPEQVICVGRAVSFGTCRGFSIDSHGIRKDCSEIVNKDISELCLAHAKQEYASFRANRMDLNRSINPLFDPLRASGAVNLGINAVHDLSAPKPSPQKSPLHTTANTPAISSEEYEALAKFNDPKMFLNAGKQGKRFNDPLLELEENGEKGNERVRSTPLDSSGNRQGQSKGDLSTLSTSSGTAAESAQPQLAVHGSVYSRRLLAAAGGQLPVATAKPVPAVSQSTEQISQGPKSPQPAISSMPTSLVQSRAGNSLALARVSPGPAVTKTSPQAAPPSSAPATPRSQSNTSSTVQSTKYAGGQGNQKLSMELNKMFKARGAAPEKPKSTEKPSTFSSMFSAPLQGTSEFAEAQKLQTSRPPPAAAPAPKTASTARVGSLGLAVDLGAKGLRTASSTPQIIDVSLAKLQEVVRSTSFHGGQSDLSVGRVAATASTTAPVQLTGLEDEIASAVSSAYTTGDELAYTEPKFFAPKFIQEAEAERERRTQMLRVEEKHGQAVTRPTGPTIEEQEARVRAAELLAVKRSHPEPKSEVLAHSVPIIKRVRPLSTSVYTRSGLLQAACITQRKPTLDDSDSDDESPLSTSPGSCSEGASSRAPSTQSIKQQRNQGMAGLRPTAEPTKTKQSQPTKGLDIFLANMSKEELEAAKSATSRNRELLEADYNQRLQQRLDKVIHAEKLEETLSKQTSKSTKLFACDEPGCLNYGTWRPSLSAACVARKHKSLEREGEIRFFACKRCKARTRTMGEWLPTEPCKCGAPLNHWEPASAMRLLGDRMPEEPKLLVRGVEHSFSLRY